MKKTSRLMGQPPHSSPIGVRSWPFNFDRKMMKDDLTEEFGVNLLEIRLAFPLVLAIFCLGQAPIGREVLD